MTRRVIAGLIVVGLGAGIWLLWPRADPPGPTATTEAIAIGTTSTSTDSGVSTTAAASSSSTTVPASHVVETVEEAEAILRELWFGWFEGIYNQDEDRIREVVATEEQLLQAKALFGSLAFTAAPTPDAIRIGDLEILRADGDCLVVWGTADASAFRGEGAEGQAVYVLRHGGGSWGLFSSWAYRDDLWEQDCEASLEPSP